jgi:transposase-like protein
MKEDPNSIKTLRSNKSPINGSILNLSIKNGMQIENLEEKQMLDLLMAPMSPHQVQLHFQNVFREQRKAHRVRQVLLKNKRRIRLLNQKFDWIAIHSLVLLEIDETFKGWKTSLLVIVDTFTGYIFYIGWLKERNARGILKAVEPIRDLFLNVALVLTDGAPYFPEVIAELCPNAKHQICLIHILRNLYPLLRPYQKKLKFAQKRLSSCICNINSEKRILQDRQRILKNCQQQLQFWYKKRDAKRIELKIKSYQPNVLKTFPILAKLNLKINEIHAYLRGDRNSVNMHTTKILALNYEKKALEKEKNVVWAEYMKQIHLLYRFYNLFHLTNNHYEEKRQLFLNDLKSYRDWELAAKITRNLTSIPQIDTVNKQDAPVRLSRNFINTNVIESTNAKIRPHLDHLRNIRNTEYCAVYFQLLRLKLNCSRPKTGARTDSCPIERCGYNLRGKTWIELLIEGLPRGPQYAINSATLDLLRASPQRVNHCKIMRAT